MRLSGFHILILPMFFLFSCSGEEGKVIPRDKFARIYAEMFVADQKIGMSDRKTRSMADTSYVYEPIFEKYGYDSDDYRASMAHYIKDADRYAKILREASSILEGEIAELKRQQAALAPLEEALVMRERYRPEKVFYMTGVGSPVVTVRDSLEFLVDSSGGEQYFDPRAWLDTAFFGPVMKIREDIPEPEEEVFPDTDTQEPEAATAPDRDIAPMSVKEVPEMKFKADMKKADIAK